MNIAEQRISSFSFLGCSGARVGYNNTVAEYSNCAKRRKWKKGNIFYPRVRRRRAPRDYLRGGGGRAGVSKFLYYAHSSGAVGGNMSFDCHSGTLPYVRAHTYNNNVHSIYCAVRFEHDCRNSIGLRVPRVRTFCRQQRCCRWNVSLIHSVLVRKIHFSAFDKKKKWLYNNRAVDALSAGVPPQPRRRAGVCKRTRASIDDDAARTNKYFRRNLSDYTRPRCF